MYNQIICILGKPIKTKLKNIMTQGSKVVIMSAFMVFVFVSVSKAQDILPVLSSEGEAYIYHNQIPSYNNGFNIYRIHEGEEERLNDEPVYPVQNGQEFQQKAGERYDDLAEDLEMDNPQEVLLRLRGNESMAMLSGSSFPEVGKALGMLYVDEQPITDESVTYRIEKIDQNAEPTGDVLEEEVVVEQVSVPEPEQAEVERVDTELTVDWYYPESTEEQDDNVIRFEVYMRPEGEENFQKVTDRSIIRQSGVTEFDYTFEPDELHSSVEIIVEAIDFTGTNTATASTDMVELVDERQPEPVLEVYSSATDEGDIELTWPVSTEPFVEGYHIDRVNQDTEERQRLTEELVDLTEPQFRDTTAEAGYNYYYYVFAVSETGIESEEGNAAIEYMSDLTPPPAPENIEATVTEDQTIEVDWDEGDQDDSFNTFVILRREIGEEDRAYSQVNEGRVTSGPIIDEGIADVSFTEGMYYEYGVVAADQDGQRSDTVFTDLQMPNITPPDPPVSFNAENNDGHRVNLRWGASPSTDVDTYQKYKITPEADTTITSFSRSQRFTMDDEVEVGEEYQYFVTAVDSAGNESEPTPSVDILMRDMSPPAPARNLQAVEATDEDGVRLRWQSSTSNDVDGYIVQRSQISNGQFEDINDEPLEDVDWKDEEGEAGKWYRVYVIDESGNKSDPSSPRQATSGD